MINRIKALREARGLSLEALAVLVGTTNQQISHLESGKRRLTVDWLNRLGAALSCHPWTLVSEDHLSGTAEGSVPADERLLLEAFRKLNKDQRRAVLTLLAIHKTESA
ncbi:helix-turn-helix domain-containing protein [Lysobacter changpingensis]|uniref:helix-turn-helix domain-containing protein n=1 Tax=Lysobacter changpingensis TaxID=2792784 RepID=UPI001A8C049C